MKMANSRKFAGKLVPSKGKPSRLPTWRSDRPGCERPQRFFIAHNGTPSASYANGACTTMWTPSRPSCPASAYNIWVRTLDVGCGILKHPGSIGIDRNSASKADVLCDLDHIPYPFADRSFDRIRAIHVIEHVADVIRAMEEFHRLLRPGGRVLIVTPHYTDFSSFCDPTHRWHLNSFSFRYFGEDHAGFGYYTPVRFREIKIHVRLLAFWRWLGFELFVNASPRFRRFWEHYLCYVVRGKVMEFELEALAAPQ